MFAFSQYQSSTCRQSGIAQGFKDAVLVAPGSVRLFTWRWTLVLIGRFRPKMQH